VFVSPPRTQRTRKRQRHSVHHGDQRDHRELRGVRNITELVIQMKWMPVGDNVQPASKLTGRVLTKKWKRDAATQHPALDEPPEYLSVLRALRGEKNPFSVPSVLS